MKHKRRHSPSVPSLAASQGHFQVPEVHGTLHSNLWFKIQTGLPKANEASESDPMQGKRHSSQELRCRAFPSLAAGAPSTPAPHSSTSAEATLRASRAHHRRDKQGTGQGGLNVLDLGKTTRKTKSKCTVSSMRIVLGVPRHGKHGLW